MVRNKFDETEARPARTLPIGAAAVGGLFVGLAFGAAAVAVAWTVESASVDQEIARVEQAPTALEQAAVVEETSADIALLHDRIATLEGELARREDKVIALESEMSRRFDRGIALRAERDQARRELESTRAELTVALADKARLTGELASTVAALDDQRRVTDDVLHSKHEGSWQRFLATARLDVCEKGGRTKTQSCRETVLAGLGDDVRGKFLHCLRSGQEEPVVREAEKNQVALPEHAMWLDQDERATRDWYIQLCDPTLPEAAGYAQRESTTGTGGNSQGS